MTFVTKEQFAEDILKMLRKCVAEEYPDATEAEREKAAARILDVWSAGMFNGPKPRSKHD
jgi:hypothetical protein